MLSNKLKSQKGFTIIEVLIVLAIAGLIMVVVFLAVPALQRNSRNNDYRSEANRIASAASEVVGNKGGGVLTAGTTTVPIPDPPVTDVDRITDAANVTNFTSIVIEVGAGGTTTPDLDGGRAVIRTGVVCSAADSTTTPDGTPREAVLLYQIETRTSVVDQCLEI